VRENAAAFGGDPARVTLFGQSSGGTSIFALLASPASRGLFTAAIALSGSPSLDATPAAVYAQNAPVVAAAGCAPGAAPPAVLACLRAANASALARALLPGWSTPGIFGNDLLSPAGMAVHYAALPFVDCVVLTHSFAAALAAGVVDVPLIMGGVASEAELGPDERVRGLSAAELRAVLRRDFGAWGARADALTDAVAAAYAADAALDAARAYETLAADYGTACAFARIAVGAKRGAFASPIYLHIDQWQPSTPVFRSREWNLTWAYHMSDMVAGFESWPRAADAAAPYPAPVDVEHARFLQRAWGQLAATGRLDAAATGGWRSVEDVPGFPAHYGRMRIATDRLPPHEPLAFVVDDRAARCAMLASFGFDERFEWMN